jgi:hypothetical protein
LEFFEQLGHLRHLLRVLRGKVGRLAEVLGQVVQFGAAAAALAA